MRVFNNNQKKGGKPHMKILEDSIDCLDIIGFSFKGEIRYIKFDKCCNELKYFKKKFGHCAVPRVYKENPDLWKCCNITRCANNKNQKVKTRRHIISEEGINWLGMSVFKWNSDINDIKLD